ncbi:hypothetical protein SO802_015098 [Lithocarpus litseifolius]|uniref:Uncharacterized protein n=1 Tax=Lithocarpus litseifolius TaxID=425828 RepID=A0AAW2CTB7_9ROSI
MVQEIPRDVDTGGALHAINLRGKTKVDWRAKHISHIQVWNRRAQLLCHGAQLEGAMSSVHPYFRWYDKVTWRLPITSKILTRYVVGSPEYKQITNVLKAVDRLHRLATHLPLEDTNGANPDSPKDTRRPSTSSTPTSHSHGQRAVPHQVTSRPDSPPAPHASPTPEFSPPPHASPASEFPPPPHASPSPKILPHIAPAFPDLEIPVPTAHASSHPEIPSPHVMDVVDRLFVAMSEDLTRVVNVVDTIRAIGEISGGHGQIECYVVCDMHC